MNNHILNSFVIVLVGLCFYSCEEKGPTETPEETYTVMYRALAVGDSLILGYWDADEQHITEIIYDPNPEGYSFINWEKQFETTGNRELKILGISRGQGQNTMISLYIFDFSYNSVQSVVHENASASEDECYNPWGSDEYQCYIVATWQLH